MVKNSVPLNSKKLYSLIPKKTLQTRLATVDFKQITTGFFDNAKMTVLFNLNTYRL